jgi:hypothetical protein
MKSMKENVTAAPPLHHRIGRRAGRLSVCALALGASPAAAAAPAILGTAREGERLSVHPAAGAHPVVPRYTWRRCDGRGNACFAIRGATARTYLLEGADVGSTLRVRVVAGATSTTTAPSAPVRPARRPRPGAVLFADAFASGPRPELRASEYAFWNQDDPRAIVSPIWEMTSGSLLAQGGHGWTGRPDACAPDVRSATCTNSAVFRLNTRRFDFRDVAVSFSLLNVGLTSTTTTAPADWDGVHIWLRYQSEAALYYASINRRDGGVVIKKKCPGGSSNGGTYYEVGGYVAGHPILFSAWQHVRASVRNEVDGSVSIRLYRDGVLVDAATDRGIGCPPITAPGAVGIRGDNDEFRLDDFRVESLG